MGNQATCVAIQYYLKTSYEIQNLNARSNYLPSSFVDIQDI